MTTDSSIYEAYRVASWEHLRVAYKGGELTKKQTRVLLARKGYDPKQIGYIIKGWD